MSPAAKSSALTYVGQPYPRIDGPDKARGVAQYVHDLAVPGMLYARIKTSPHARARILSVDTAAARALPGVRAVLTGQDLAYKMGLYMVDKDILARDQVRYYGEMVAAVAADEEWIAEKACELIHIDYEPLPPVLDPRQAFEPGAPLVHEQLHEYNYMKGVFNPLPGRNVPHHQKVYRGDLDEGLKAADKVYRHSFYNPPVSHGFLETHVAIVHALPGDKAEIITSAQSPYTVRNLFSLCLGLPLKNVHVKVPYVGGGFGGKAGIHIEPLVYCLSKAAGHRPVKLTCTREESLYTMPSRQALYTELTTGVKRDGTITALQATYYWDAGAYADYGVNIGRAAAYSGAGPYYVPNVKIDSYVIYTNKTFGTAYRGFGHLEVLWGIERNLDLIAADLGLDPLALRLTNVLRPGHTTITGELVTAHHGRPDLCLEAVAKAIDWEPGRPHGDPAGARHEPLLDPAGRPGTRYRGKGIAALHKAPAMPTFTSCAVVMKFNEDATVDLLVTGVDYGQGTYTALAQIAAEVLRIPPERVNVIWECDTNYTPYDWQTVASRFAFMGGNATIQAARDCLDQIKRMAAVVFRCPVEELVCEDGQVWVSHRPQEALPYQRFALGYVFPNGNAIGGPVIGHGRYIAQGLTNLDANGQGLPALDWTYGAHAVEVEVDTATGEVEVLRIASAFDAGKVLNAQQVQTQITGGVVQGLGSALFEEYVIDPHDGVFKNNSFVDYKMPTAKDIPRQMSQHIIETPQLDGPFGARGVAEHPMISVPSAIGNALQDALGLRISALPLNNERVFFACREALTGEHHEQAHAGDHSCCK